MASSPRLSGDDDHVRIDDAWVSVPNPHLWGYDEVLMALQPPLSGDDDRLRVKNDQLLDENGQVMASSAFGLRPG
jgi:hypothetical protein